MAGEWRDITLGDFVALQRGHDLTEPERRTGRVPVMGSAGQNGFHDTALAKGPGIVIGRSGASFGQVHFTKEDFWPHNTGLYVTDFKGNDPLFAFYFLKALDFDRFNSGSAQPSLNRNFIYPIPIRVPKPAEQKAIAAVLGALDDKIELNRRMNATLEAMARALFQSWFVDFDPVRAKLDRRPPAALDPATATLFPEHLEDSPLGHIPKGWEVKTADEVSTVGIGKTPPRMEHRWFSENPADVPWMSIRDLGNAGVFISHTSEFLTAEAVEKFRVKRIPDDTVVLSFKLTMGRVAITDGEMLSNEAIAHFRLNPDTIFGSAYLYCYLKGFGYDQLGSTSSIATAINSDMVRGMRVLVPPKGIADAFERTVKPLFAQMKNIQKQSHTLATLRDTLLPKLLSGEIITKSIAL
jgi:type I restriction enzyme S subunit